MKSNDALQRRNYVAVILLIKLGSQEFRFREGLAYHPGGVTILDPIHSMRMPSNLMSGSDTYGSPCLSVPEYRERLPFCRKINSCNVNQLV